MTSYVNMDFWKNCAEDDHAEMRRPEETGI